MTEKAELQPLIRDLMATLLVRTDLLDQSDKKNLESPRFCKERLELRTNGKELLRPVEKGYTVSEYSSAEGRHVERPRFWKEEFGSHYVTKEWPKRDHEHNAKRLRKFVEGLIERKAYHPDRQELGKHLQAFETYLRPTRSSSRPSRAAQPSRPVGEVPQPTRPARRSDPPRNRILYGPPGTGKTYSTVSHALAIVDGVKPNAETADPDRQRFRRLRFTRAHDASAVLVETLSEKKAKEVMTAFGEDAEGRIAMVTFHQNYAYEDFVEGIRPKLTDSVDGDADADEESGATGASPSSELDYELRPGIFRRICKAAEAERRDAASESREPERFVLVIDEINRGNIPKIFGELITLIEPSRRLGAGDETTVTLPYSGNEFGVPDNLYIIGTMNTADRSIQQMDTALRRRFTFVEMMPDANHDLISQDVDGVNCRKMLRAMNERIALLLDREHQIGHTYLFGVETIKDLADTFRDRIFPLLQEYFYDDWRKIRAVLGNNAFVQERPSDDGYRTDLAEDFGLDSSGDKVYDRVPLDDERWKDVEQYKQIYANSRKT